MRKFLGYLGRFYPSHLREKIYGNKSTRKNNKEIVNEGYSKREGFKEH